MQRSNLCTKPLLINMKEKNRNAVTLVELIVTIVILGVMTLVSVPRLRYSIIHGKQADAFSKKILTDLRRTRQLAITDAAANTDGFELSIDGLTYEIKDLSDNTTISNGTFSIDSKITCSGGTRFQFGPLGNLKTGSDTSLTVSSGGKSFTISVIPATGIVKCTEN